MGASAAATEPEIGTVTELARAMPVRQARAQAQKLLRAEQIPVHQDCISGPNGVLQLRAEDRKVAAILSIAGPKQAIIVWTGKSHDREVLAAASSRLEAFGWTVVNTYEAEPSLIELCYDRETFKSSRDAIEESAALALLDQILTQAVEMGASDIHLQMLQHSAIVRLRIHGELVDLRPMSRPMMETMVRAAYTAAEVESRRTTPSFDPREYIDASLKRDLVVKGRMQTLTLRWASGPVSPDGFDLQLRLQAMQADGTIRTFAQLGYTPEQISLIEEALAAPAGAIVLVGSTGSGKSTTQASMAKSWLDRHEGRKSLRTIEDPVEIIVPGARHMPVNRDKGGKGGDNSGFQVALRAAMRMDPDAILIGEVRDGETAVLMQHTIQTGHKVFATVHASSPLDAIGRLSELGIGRNYLCAENFINLIIYQVLIPLLCPDCKVRYSEHRNLVSDSLQDAIARQFGQNDGAICLRGPGCARCQGGTPGHLGRTVLATMFQPDRTIRQHLRQEDDTLAEAYWRGALSATNAQVQAISLREHGLRLVAEGRVSPIAIDGALGGLIDARSSENEREWYQEQMANRARAG